MELERRQDERREDPFMVRDRLPNAVAASATATRIHQRPLGRHRHRQHAPVNSPSITHAPPTAASGLFTGPGVGKALRPAFLEHGCAVSHWEVGLVRMSTPPKRMGDSLTTLFASWLASPERQDD
jgi:hypothetical protein